MKFKQIESIYFLRVDPDEELIGVLKKFCKEHNVNCGKVSAIGAVNEVEIGVFEPATKEYHSKKLRGDFEITSLLGNITQMNSEPYLHLHINLANADYECFGGHLNRAIVSVTCEVIIETFAGNIERKFSDKLGVNLI